MTTNRRREVRWIKGALRDFDDFPPSARQDVSRALVAIQRGETPDVAKPLRGLGPGVWELAIRTRGDAYRVVYALQIGDEIWIIHAFQKKSKSGIATPKHEIDLVRERLKKLRS